jgi:ubiquinone/menaquinone biosynthesis C-methylase UbiE
MCGFQLLMKGYANLDGLDPNKEMLEVAIRKNVYKDIHCAFIGDGNELPFPTSKKSRRFS